MGHSVKLQRSCSQRTGDKFIRKHLEYMLGRALSGNRATGWSASPKSPTAVQEGENWVFAVTIHFSKDGGRKPEAAEKQWSQIVHYLAEAGKSGKIGTYPWTIVEVDGKPYTYKNGEEPKVGDVYNKPTIEKKSYGSISLEVGNHFDHIYKREPQVKIIHSAIEAAAQSNFNNRFHVVLFGEPASGKTDILLSIANMLGKENESYLKFDATSTTAAGASKLLLDADFLPPVLIAEEIEKTEESSLRWLLGVLDQRAEIRRTNYRIGNRFRSVKMLVLATVNDISLFEKVMSGALASRFPNKIYCPRPDREIMRKILQREVQKIKGKEEWIEPTLKFCLEEMKWNDPRKLIPICIQGKDGLLDGSYQAAVRAVQFPGKSN